MARQREREVSPAGTRAESPSRAHRARRRVVRVLRRVPSRTILLICFSLTLVSVLLVTVPLTTTDSGGVELKCGPPLYEVFVPADPAFEVPEDVGCRQPARQRVALAGVLFGAAFLIAVVTQLVGRGETRYHHSRWLRGPRPSRKVRKRQAAARAAAQARALDEVVGQGSTLARSSDRNVSAASSVSGPGHRATS